MPAIKSIFTFTLVIILALFYGCSGKTSPVTVAQMPESLDTIPIIGVTDIDGTFNATGLFGAFELTINPDDLTADLVSKRMSAIGEDYIVSGIGFFTIMPCANCLTIMGIELSSGNIILNFQIDHPFQPGIIGDLPTATNRLDLDVFDLAMVIAPDDTPTTYSAMGMDIHIDVLAQPDGYTTELASVISDTAAIPYVLVKDESGETTHTFNKFSMGETATFDVAFELTSGVSLNFDMYLTMGYGASAKKPQRLEPKYYNPEFNRKSAWKVEAYPMGAWLDNDDTTTVDVQVKVYDWQSGATVYTNPDDFENAPENNIYAASDVDSVSVEIPGMNSTLQTISSPSGGTGAPDNPLVFNVPVANTNLIPIGTYTGLVKVLDERSCLTVLDGRDIIIDAPDGVTLTNYTMPEYSTYQCFDATVIASCTDYCWTKTWGGTMNDRGRSVALDQSGNVYVTGIFAETVDFNPDGGGTHSSKGNEDAYLSKFNSSGLWLWTKTWGGTDWDRSQSVALDQSGNIFVCGSFQGTADFNPDGGGSENSNGNYDAYFSKFDSSGNWLWTKTWGGLDTDMSELVELDQSGNVYVAGHFKDTVNFNPDGGGSHSSHGNTDVFLSKFDSNGNWQWTKTWGGSIIDYVKGLESDQAGSIYVSGDFSSTVNFNPDGIDLQASNGSWDAYLSKFNSSGTWQWSKTWGGAYWDTGESVTLDQSGNIYACGSFENSAEFNPAGGGAQPSNGQIDAYLSRFDSSGNWQWAKTWGGASGDYALDVALDHTGNDIYITGAFSSTAQFDPDGGGSQTSNGSEDIFLSKINSTGSWQWAKTWGGSTGDYGDEVILDYVGNTFVVGAFTTIVEFNPDGGDMRFSRGNRDAFLTKMNY